MRPKNLKTKIFLDSGDPEETKEIIDLLGFLDGQTTNPTLIAKNPAAKKRFEQGDKFSEQEIYDFYKQVVTEISGLIPQGSVSIEVYADNTTPADQMLEQAQTFFKWVPNAHIKLPITAEGLKTAQQAVKEGIRLNMTLCFTQAQAAAVYAATQEAKKGAVFLSPFVGRLDDLGENGMNFIANIIKMYQPGDGHVEVLTASVRNLDHFLYAMALGSDIITAPFKILKEWVGKEMPVPDAGFQYNANNLKSLPYQDLGLDKNWPDYNINHELTTKGIQRFSDDWNALIE